MPPLRLQVLAILVRGGRPQAAIALTPVAVPGLSPMAVPALPITGVIAQRVTYAAATDAGATGDVASAVGAAAAGAAGAGFARRLDAATDLLHVTINSMHDSARVKAVDAQLAASVR